MAFNIGKIIITVVMIVVSLAVLVGLYPTFSEYIDNVTGSGFGGTLILVVAKTLYWIISSAVIILEMLVGFGLFELVKMMNRMK